ncbi:HAD-IA family hydrolase [Modestobacter sp. I12A-02628]|uniref:HAD family phosphatase n=1 Tax=Goekera deserti TaxID=2497753 RepID=A0A7K3WJT9_9ACTN|nr:HAD family phosphatase [Goekera deserti]MPQ98971.1 HAD-IA family hydrolase [Goekera deserti]NDI50575.1 HAD-IA family hydrolase [Goekera deserti]NEL56636.1 HAD family phosphatase [Goekera deserti]
MTDLDLPALGTTTVLCDADGNLFPSEEPAFVASAGVTNDFLESLGIDQRFTAEELRLATTGKNFRTTAVDLAVTHGVALDPAVAAGHRGAPPVQAPDGDRVLTAEELDRWVAEEKRQVSAHLGSVLVPDPDVLEPLGRLAARYRLAAVSSSATARLAACFTATGLDPLIAAEVRFSAEDSLPTPTSKPDPAVYLFACEQLGVEPAAGLAVEDSIPGARSAVAAGIPTIGNLQFVAPAERAERERQLRDVGVLAVVTSWGELERLLSPRAEPAATG